MFDPALGAASLRSRRPTTNLGIDSKSLGAALGIWLALLAGAAPLEARSTLTARFAEASIAGPGIAQRATLYLHYFPGDGEAIVRAELQGGGGAVLTGAQSALGRAQPTPPSIEIDYAARPLASARVDTLHIDLQAEALTELYWSVAVYSSLEPDGAPAHQTRAELAVAPPPAVDWSLAPQQVYQGERFDLRALVHYAAEEGDEVEELTWAWPPELVWAEGEAPANWVAGMVPGQLDTLTWSVRAVTEQSGAVVLGAAARMVGQSAVPLPVLHIQIDPLPLVALEADFMQVGQRGPIACVWRNATVDPIRLEALRLEVNPTFADAALVEAPAGATLVEGEQGRSVLVDGLQRLGPGEEIRLVLEAVPQRPGPFTWQSACKPVGRDKFIALRGANTINVVWSGIAAAEAAADQLPTDLQLVNRAFAGALARQVDALPLAPGTRLYLQAEDQKNDANWIVEDALIDALQERGYQVLVRQPESAEADVVYYRLVRARVVYSPEGKGLFPWGKGQRREAYGDLFLRLETAADAIVRWDRRVQAYDWDRVPKGGIDVLGGGDMVEQTVIKPENKAIERSLSAGIVGGLFYIFFVL